MAVAVSMANDGRDVHPFFIPKASESPSRQFTLILKISSNARYEQISDTLWRTALVRMTSIAKGKELSRLVRSLLQGIH